MNLNNGHPDHESTASRLPIRGAAYIYCSSQGTHMPRPSTAPHWLGPCKHSCNPFDRGCRLHILRCEPRCAMHVAAVVIRCKSSLSRTASPTHQDTCRFPGCSRYAWARGSPRANRLLPSTAVVTFMVHPSKTKIETSCFPVAGTASPPA